ncbi:MAG: hypothetical protein AAF191_08835 [Verrucomicrobiota bacterium]
MEPWKILLLIAALPTIGSVALSVMNKNEISATIDNREAQEIRVENTQNQLDRTKETLAETETETAELNADTDVVQNQLATVQAQVSESELQIQTLKDQVVEADEKIRSFDELKRVVGEIDMISGRIASLRNEIQDSEDSLDQVNNLLAVNEAKKENSDRAIETKEAMESFRNAGQNWKDIRTTVTASFNDWGFVVIGAGYDQNVNGAAVLDVTRQGKPICKLLVTEVQLDKAIADIVPNSLVAGQRVQIGDRVSKPAAVQLP